MYTARCSAIADAPYEYLDYEPLAHVVGAIPSVPRRSLRADPACTAQREYAPSRAARGLTSSGRRAWVVRTGLVSRTHVARPAVDERAATAYRSPFCAPECCGREERGAEVRTRRCEVARSGCRCCSRRGWPRRGMGRGREDRAETARDAGSPSWTLHPGRASDFAQSTGRDLRFRHCGTRVSSCAHSLRGRLAAWCVCPEPSRIALTPILQSFPQCVEPTSQLYRIRSCLFGYIPISIWVQRVIYLL